MSWAEIKKALNSTLGTSGFKSLDVIMNDAKTQIINGNSVAAPSNTVRFTKTISTPEYSDNKQDSYWLMGLSAYFTPLYSGVYKIKSTANINFRSTAYDQAFISYVHKDAFGYFGQNIIGLNCMPESNLVPSGTHKFISGTDYRSVKYGFPFGTDGVTGSDLGIYDFRGYTKTLGTSSSAASQTLNFSDLVWGTAGELMAICFGFRVGSNKTNAPVTPLIKVNSLKTDVCYDIKTNAVLS